MNRNYSPALNLAGFPGIRNALPDPVAPGPVAPMQSLEDAGPMPLERTHEDNPHDDIYHDLQLYDSSPQSGDPQDAPMIDRNQLEEIERTRNLDNIEHIMNDARIAALNARSVARSVARSAARSAARCANFKGRGQPGGSKSKRKKQRTTRRKKTRKHTRK